MIGRHPLPEAEITVVPQPPGYLSASDISVHVTLFRDVWVGQMRTFNRYPLQPRAHPLDHGMYLRMLGGQIGPKAEVGEVFELLGEFPL